MSVIRDGCFRIAAKKGHAIARLALLTDHLHLALRGNIEQSPQEIALGFQNNLAFMLGQVRIWNDGFYAGTFSEYDFGAILRGNSKTMSRRKKTADKPQAARGAEAAGRDA